MSNNKQGKESFGLGGSGCNARAYAFTVWFEGRQVDVLDDNKQIKESYWCEAVDFEKMKERLTDYFDLSSNVRYVCCSQERCPSENSGLLHGHLFIRLVDGVSGVKLAREICGFSRGQAWFEEVRSDFAAFEYSACVGHFAENQPKGKKPPLDFWEKGERPKSKPISKKKDFAACFEMLKSGAALMDVCSAYPEIALKGFTNLQKLYLLIREEGGKKRIDRNIAENNKREKEEVYFLNPYFEPQKASVDDVLKLFS